ncbi:MAG: hypothetical protein EBZ93_11835 [Actinobacteria bacterium]|nr:hypothetical protein [Actinomycetota bacterium]
MLEERNESGGHRDDLLGREIDEVDLARRHVENVGGGAEEALGLQHALQVLEAGRLRRTTHEHLGIGEGSVGVHGGVGRGELNPGVNQEVKVLVAQKRKIGVGDKLAGRHGRCRPHLGRRRWRSHRGLGFADHRSVQDRRSPRVPLAQVPSFEPQHVREPDPARASGSGAEEG